MQGPPVNLVLLGLLILFFGLQMRRRSEQPYSGWLLGWVLVFISYLIYYFMPLLPAPHLVMEMARIDTLTLGIASFLLAFLQRAAGLRRTLLLSSLTLGPILILFDLQMVYPSPVIFYEALAVFAGASAVFVAYRLLPRHWARRRSLLYGLAVVSTICVIAALRTDPERFLTDAFQTPLLIAVAVFYLASSRSSPTVRALGAIGFLLWAEFYALQDILPRSWNMKQLIYQYWELPKYFAGTAMVLDLFEASRRDVERLAGRYRTLYENLNVLYEGHPHPMWIQDAGSRRMLSANAAAINSYGFTLEELLGMPASALELPEDLAAIEDMSPRPPVDSSPLAPGSRRAFHRRKNGEIVSVVVTERRQIFEGRNAIVVLAVDVTEQEKLHQELFHRANHDPLTQLPNRELLADRVAQVLARSDRDGKCAVLLTIDVDHFKQINDTYGHPVGDECLKLVASRLQSRIRSVDTLARTGGEEFTVIIGGLSRREDAVTVAETLRRLFDEPLFLEDRVLPITISIGGALFPEDGTTLDTLRKRSDDALYRAKRAGRNRCMFTSTVMQ